MLIKWGFLEKKKKKKACSLIILDELYRPICVMEPIIC